MAFFLCNVIFVRSVSLAQARLVILPFFFFFFATGIVLFANFRPLSFVRYLLLVDFFIVS